MAGVFGFTAHTAIQLRDESLATQAHDALFPVRGEVAGGTTAVISFGSVDDILATLDQYLIRI
ncbi:MULTISPECIES: hypothetical protein [unclassified Streptomyces]|uniref:hypothetical protein n=1 Tax=unclassified Streptomyces TaxID=2593676 RepID=UPI003D940EFC